MKDFNKMSIEEHINYLEETFRYDSSGTSKSVAELIAAYRVKNCNTPVVVKSVCFVCNKKQPTVCQDCFAKEVFRVDE